VGCRAVYRFEAALGAFGGGGKPQSIVGHWRRE
jgi:hypothetical protein